MDIYNEYMNKLVNGLLDYHSAKTEEDRLEALEFLSDQAQDFVFDLDDEKEKLAEKLNDEAYENEREQEEAYRGQY